MLPVNCLVAVPAAARRSAKAWPPHELPGSSNIQLPTLSTRRQNSFPGKGAGPSRRGVLIAAFLALFLTLEEGLAQVEVLPDEESQRVFAGERAIRVALHNPGEQRITVELSARILQATSAIAAPIGNARGRLIEVPPDQTVLEQVPLPFPAVRAETRFIIQWHGMDSRVWGHTDVLVYPTNLLSGLNAIGRKHAALGVFDPDNLLKPALISAGVQFEELTENQIGSFDGGLAIVVPFETTLNTSETLLPRMRALVKRGVAVVWLKSPVETDRGLHAWFQITREEGSVVIAAPREAIANLSDRPQSQLNLVELCRLALNPGPPLFADLNQKP